MNGTWVANDARCTIHFWGYTSIQSKIIISYHFIYNALKIPEIQFDVNIAIDIVKEVFLF